jgi:hypothetical protein
VRFVSVLLILLVPAMSLAGGRVKDEVRVFSDGSPEEVWTYLDSIAEPNLREKAFFWPNGTKRRVEMWDGPVQSGPATGWHDNGSLESEAQWEDGLKHGVFKTYESVADALSVRVQGRAAPWLTAPVRVGGRAHRGAELRRRKAPGRPKTTSRRCTPGETPTVASRIVVARWPRS